MTNGEDGKTEVPDIPGEGDDRKAKPARRRERFDYFDAFEKMADLALEEADLLADVIGGFTTAAAIEPRLADAHAIEAASDRIVDSVLEAADGDFVTPIDREDLVELSIALDEVTDELEKVVKHLYMYDVASIEPPAVEMCALIREECLTVQDGMRFFRDFRKPKKLRERAERIDELEDEVDCLYLRAVRGLFTDGRDTIDVVKWRAVYSTIEECSDNVERAADLMTRIVVKNN